MRQVRKLDPRDIIIHRQFDYRAATHDVALLRVTEDINEGQADVFARSAGRLP